jgi:hypothetical protein
MYKYFRTVTATFILLTVFTSCSIPQPEATDTPMITPSSTSTLSESTGTHEKTRPTEEPSSEEKTPLPMTPTPTVCTGWRRTVSGTVYGGEARSRNELEGVSVTITQISSCSTTAGEYQTVTDPEGVFKVEDLYIHDMDTIDMLIEHDGYKTVEQKLGGIEIFRLGSSVEIILEPESY